MDLISVEASVGRDVMGSSFLVRFFQGQTQAFLQLQVTDDDVLESDETFLVRLSNPIMGIVEESSEAIVTILDDECEYLGILAFFSCLYVCVLLVTLDIENASKLYHVYGLS